MISSLSSNQVVGASFSEWLEDLMVAENALRIIDGVIARLDGQDNFVCENRPPL